MLKLPLLGAWNSASSSPMTALLSISRTRLGVRGDPGLWHYCEGFWCLMLALDLRCKHTGWSTWPAPPPGSTGHLVLSPTMTAMSADLAGRLEFSPCSVLSPLILFWGHSTQSGCVLLQCGVSPPGALALESSLLSGAQLGWVLLAFVSSQLPKQKPKGLRGSERSWAQSRSPQMTLPCWFSRWLRSCVSPETPRAGQLGILCLPTLISYR